MDSTAAHPLRPYYVPQPVDHSWSSLSPAGGPPTSTTIKTQPITSPSFTRPNRYEPTSLFGQQEGPSAGLILRGLLTSSVLTFTSTALVMPFEVGKTLAQVQWVPRDGVEPTLRLDENVFNQGDDEDAIDLEDDNDAYFSDLSPRATETGLPLALPLDHPLDGQAEPARRTIPRPGPTPHQFADKPEWIMPVVVQGGVWDMIKTVGRWKGEGWASLWKAQLTTCVLDSASSAVQPIFLSGLSLLFLPASSLVGLPLIYSPRPGPLLLLSALSHTITSVLFSPLDLIRTRLIVQSAQPAHRKYSGPIDALQTIVREEGGWSALYLHPNLLLPTLLDGLIRPLIHLASPLIISRYLHLEPSTAPVWFGLAELVLGATGLLLTIPIETVRKRLQIQSRAKAEAKTVKGSDARRAWRTCVETRPTPYAGVVEAVYRILTEETGQIPRRRRTSRGSQLAVGEVEEKEDLHGVGLGAANGLRQLYRGFGMGLSANVVVFVLGLVAGGNEPSGWAEI